jgi:hypothetical protein
MPRLSDGTVGSGVEAEHDELRLRGISFLGFGAVPSRRLSLRGTATPAVAGPCPGIEAGGAAPDAVAVTRCAGTEGSSVDRRSAIAIALAVGLVALGICCYQLALPNVLLGVHGSHGYDDGVDFGIALRLVNGAVPYRDVAFLQPPGIALLLSPLALLARLIGSRDCLAVARCLTAAVTALDAGLAAIVVRGRGRIAMLASGLALAVYPMAVAADHSVMLEPYLVCFCLLGFVAMFVEGRRLAGSARMLGAGSLIGFAGCVKLWAIFPAVAAVICCLPRSRKAIGPLLVGLLLGFVVPSLPFFLAAPSSFLHEVVLDQLTRSSSAAVGVPERLAQITALSALDPRGSVTTAAVVLSILAGAVVVLIYRATWRRSSRLDWLVLLSVVLVLAGMFSSAPFYDHYAYFVAALAALVLGVVVSRLAAAAEIITRNRAPSLGRRARRSLALLPGVLVVAAAAAVLPGDVSYASSYLGDSYDPAAIVAASVARGSCVVFDRASLVIDANRFEPESSSCPQLLDPFGLWLADDHGRPPPAAAPPPAAFVALWGRMLARADFVVLTKPFSDLLPWTPRLERSFERRFALVASSPDVYVYRAIGTSPAS